MVISRTPLITLALITPNFNPEGRDLLWSQIKTIEKSLGNQETKQYKPLRNESTNMSDMVYNLRKEILMKEKFIIIQILNF